MLICQFRKWHTLPDSAPISPYTDFSSNKPMNDFLTEIQDAPGEIFDIPEMQDLYDEKKFDVEEYINGDIDY